MHLSDCPCSEDYHRELVLLNVYVRPNGCWLWALRSLPYGYGTIFHVRERWYAHRFAYEALVGDIPDGLVVDHLCRDPACVRPDHLEAVTQQENTRRGRLSNANSDLAPVPRRRFLSPGDPRHGKASSYVNWGCRCRSCSDAHRLSEREKYLGKRLPRPVPVARPIEARPASTRWPTRRDERGKRYLEPGDPLHGTYTGYTGGNCRCVECRAAAHRYYVNKAA